MRRSVEYVIKGSLSLESHQPVSSVFLARKADSLVKIFKFGQIFLSGLGVKVPLQTSGTYHLKVILALNILVRGPSKMLSIFPEEN